MPGILRTLLRMLFDHDNGLHLPPRYWRRVLPRLVAFLAQVRLDRVESIAARHAPLLLPALDRHREMAAEIGGSGLLRMGPEAMSADAMVVAAGAWSARLLRPLGIRVPLGIQRGYHVELPPESLGISRIVAHHDAKAFITPMEQALRIAGTVEMAGLDAPPSPHRAEALMAGLVRAFPYLAGQRPLRTWMGHRPCLPDSMPVIGPSARFAGLWYGFGHGHPGVTSAAVTGEALASAMPDNRPKPDLGPHALERF